MNTPYKFIYKAPQQIQEGKQPAIFLLHGLGSNEQDLFQLVDTFQTNCHIFGLQGPISHSPGYAFYTFEEEGKPVQDVFDKVLQVTRGFIAEAMLNYEIDPEQIYVVGFNQGAVLAQSLALVMGNMIRGTVVLSGYLPEFVKVEYNKYPMDQAHIFISHGEYDYDYPISWGQESAAFFEDYGTNVTFKQYPDGHGVTQQNLQDLVAFLAQLMPKHAQA